MKRNGDIASLFQKHAAKKAAIVASSPLSNPDVDVVENGSQEEERIIEENIDDTPLPAPPPPPVYDINYLPRGHTLSSNTESATGYYDESLRPPPESGGDGDDGSWDWGEALIDTTAYMIEERNHTSARCTFIDNFDDMEEVEVELQVTFRLAPPPRISYLCCVGGDFVYEPRIVSTEGNLALITLMHGSDDPSRSNYFVYRAPIHGDDEPPMLSRLPNPSPDLFPPGGRSLRFFYPNHVGILRYSTRKGSSSPFTPSLNLAPDTALAGRRLKSNSDDQECDAYKIAALYLRFTFAATEYDLYVYDSKDDAWTCKSTVFSRPDDSPTHLSNKVITVGGTMGWVDLRYGIILCDSLLPPGSGDQDKVLVRYIPLPEPRQQDNHPEISVLCTASFFRDVVVDVQGRRIKLVDLQIHVSPGSLVPNGWTAVTWSMELGDSGFGTCPDSELHSRDIVVNGGLDPSLFVGHPTLSSHEYGTILYLMTKVNLLDRESRVVAVNIKTKKLEGVTKFTTQRSATMNLAYTRTSISNYLSPDPKQRRRRRVPAISGSSRKKPRPAMTFMSKQSSAGYDGDKVENHDQVDNMDVEY